MKLTLETFFLVCALPLMIVSLISLIICSQNNGSLRLFMNPVTDRLDFADCFLSDSMLQKLAKECPSLTSYVSLVFGFFCWFWFFVLFFSLSLHVVVFLLLWSYFISLPAHIYAHNWTWHDYAHRLNLKGNAAVVTNASLQFVLRRQTSLTCLGLAECRYLTDAIAPLITAACPRLSALVCMC